MPDMTVQITFTGLCLFREEGDGVVVDIVDASTKQEHCGLTLDPHMAEVIATEDHRGGSPADHEGHTIRGMDVMLLAREKSVLRKPTRLAEVHEFAGRKRNPGEAPSPGRLRGRVKLLGGSWAENVCRRASQCTSGPWRRAAELRWQATWQGTVDGDGLSLLIDSGATPVKFAPVDGKIELVVANVMHHDLKAWKAPRGTPLPTGQLKKDEDFRWFFWMYDWEDGCEQQDVPTPASGKAAVGLPYTCLNGGG